MKFVEILILCFVILQTSCTSNRNLGLIPVELDDFSHPLNILEQQYPEINVYKIENLFVGYCTPIEQLVNVWGSPDKIETVWAQVPIIVLPIVFLDGITTGGLVATGIVFTMYPKQPQHYIWNKGNYTIDAYVGTEFNCGYESRLWHWNWTENSTLTTSSSESNIPLGKKVTE